MIPLQCSTAFAASSARGKVMFAIPRLAPPGPYESSTLLMGPMVFMKYSYLSKVWLVIRLSLDSEFASSRHRTSNLGMKGKAARITRICSTHDARNSNYSSSEQAVSISSPVSISRSMSVPELLGIQNHIL